MPPLRNLPPVKLPLKTERTHEENQERAYIAASRRSDRSLEARVESARRASEIHKKRTGRSLRVTESDVMNEEMYEEEDDDLPAQYRRLTAHLHTQNAQFDRRWQAYLVNQVAMRSALGQSMPNNGQPDPMLGAMTGLMGPMSPMQQMPGSPNQMMPQQMFNQPSANYMQSPYSSAHNATPQGVSGYGDSGASAPSQSLKTEEEDGSLSTQSRPSLKRSAPSGQLTPTIKREQPSTPMSSSDIPAYHEQSQQNFPSPFAFGSPFNNINDNSSNPLSMSLPMESQQLLAGAPIDLNDPMWAAMMNNPYSNQGAYSYKPNGFNPSNDFSGLSQTLAPSDLTFNKAGNVTNSSWDQPDPPQMPKVENNDSGAAAPGKLGASSLESPGGTHFDDSSWSAFIDEGGIFGSDDVNSSAET